VDVHVPSYPLVEEEAPQASFHSPDVVIGNVDNLHVSKTMKLDNPSYQTMTTRMTRM
jgi:aspartate carbamoyltransferase regulatory subunit